MVGSGPPSNTWFLEPNRVLNPNDISIGAAVFVRLTSVTDRQRDRLTWLRSSAMWPKNMVTLGDQGHSTHLQCRHSIESIPVGTSYPSFTETMHLFMAALRNRAGHYIFALWFLSSSFFPFPRLISAVAPSQIGCLPYFHTWCGLSVNLGCRSETCCCGLLEMQDATNCQKFAIGAPSHNFVGPYLRN